MGILTAENNPKEFNSSPCLGTLLCGQFPLNHVKGSFDVTCEFKYKINLSLLCNRVHFSQNKGFKLKLQALFTVVSPLPYR